VEISNFTEKEQRATQLLLQYMQNHPEAKHTAEGIARWWILQQKLEEEVGVVEKVIAYFTDVGVLEKVLMPDDNSYFKFHPEKVEDGINV